MGMCLGFIVFVGILSMSSYPGGALDRVAAAASGRPINNVGVMGGVAPVAPLAPAMPMVSPMGPMVGGPMMNPYNQPNPCDVCCCGALAGGACCGLGYLLAEGCG